MRLPPAPTTVPCALTANGRTAPLDFVPRRHIQPSHLSRRRRRQRRLNAARPRALGSRDGTPRAAHERRRRRVRADGALVLACRRHHRTGRGLELERGAVVLRARRREDVGGRHLGLAAQRAGGGEGDRRDDAVVGVEVVLDAGGGGGGLAAPSPLQADEECDAEGDEERDEAPCGDAGYGGRGEHGRVVAAGLAGWDGEAGRAC